MRILISNDDGFQSDGIIALAEALSVIADIKVVAPSVNRSAASNSLTLEMPIRATQHANGFVSVDGTPTDCVHLALTGLMKDEPNMVVAGINDGANLGDDVLYSGTVAAATEGRFLGLPAIAVSMVSHAPKNYATGAKVAVELVQRLLEEPLASDTIINVNVPDVPYELLQGYQATRLGNRHKAEPVIKAKDPRGKTIYWVGPPGATADARAGTDFYAVAQGFVSVTPLQVDLTRHNLLQKTATWLEAMQ